MVGITRAKIYHVPTELANPDYHPIFDDGEFGLDGPSRFLPVSRRGLDTNVNPLGDPTWGYILTGYNQQVANLIREAGISRWMGNEYQGEAVFTATSESLEALQESVRKNQF